MVLALQYFIYYSVLTQCIYLLGASFFYELVEDWRIKDYAYHDLRGWLIGFPVGFLFAIGVKLLFLNVWPTHFITTTFWL